MTDTVTIPRHLQILGEAWLELARRIDIAPAIPCETDELEFAQLDLFKELSDEELFQIRSWVRRIEDWINLRLATALQDERIADADMRRTAERLWHFADELVEHRERLRCVARDPAMRAAAPRFDAVHLELLVQVKEFAAQVVESLGSEALMHLNAERHGHILELSFAFTPRADRGMADLRAWLQRANERLQTSQGCPCVEDVGDEGDWT
ncbi:MAG: hypothetical protein U1F22_11695 [Lysobacterales bacterium]